MRYDKSGGESNEPSPESRTPQNTRLAHTHLHRPPEVGVQRSLCRSCRKHRSPSCDILAWTALEWGKGRALAQRRRSPTGRASPSLTLN